MSTITCPSCGSKRTWRDGTRQTRNGDVQRYICRSCGYRFSETTWNGSDDTEYVQRVHRESLNTHPKLFSNRQVGVTKPEGAKNLVEVESRIEKRAAGATKDDKATVKGKIIEFIWHLKNNGYRKATIKSYGKILNQLCRLGADLLNPESVKEIIAQQQEWNETTKLHVATAYNTFLEACLDIKWRPPRYRKQEKIPYVPAEEEIDQLIAGSGKKLSTFLRLLKETGMRCGEAIRLEWTDVDLKSGVVRIESEKGGLPRILPISSKLVGMLENLPKRSIRIFPGTLNSMRFNLQVTRARLARKLNNPRLKRITFHSLRHWKGTIEYHKTKDIIHVKETLGHRDIKSTMVYIHIERALFHHGKPEEFHVKVAKTPEEACQLVEVGFEYVCHLDGNAIFRKRK